MQCDMCGKDTSLVVAEIEGTELNVCNNCAKYGKFIKKVGNAPKVVHRKKKKAVQETTKVVVNDYAKKIRQAREKLQLKQDQFASRLNEKTSVIQSLETEKMRPSIKLAQKLEKTLGIKLIEEIDESEFEKPSSKSDNGSLTIGDLIKVKKKD